VNLAAHAFPEGGVDHAMARQGQFAGKGRSDDGGFKVHAIGALDVDSGTGKASLNELAHKICIHVGGDEQHRRCRKLGLLLYSEGSP